MVFCCCGCVPKPCSLCLAGSLAARCGKHAKKNWKVSALFSSSRVSEGTLGTFWGFRCYVLGHEIRWCFAVADASQSHAACAWQARWSSNFSKCAKPTEICRKNIWTKNTFIANLCLSGSGMMWICIWTVHYIPRHFLVSTNASLGLRGTSFPPRSRRSPSKFQALLMEPKALIKILEAKLLDGGYYEYSQDVNDACI